MNLLEFDPVDHVYTREGIRVPGVTTVLESVGLSDFSMVPQDILAQALAHGTEVHNVTELFDKNEKLPEMSSAASECLCQWIAFLGDHNAEILEIEKRVFSKKFFYAGTLDRILILRKLSERPVVLDIKTGIKCASHRIQTASYEYAFNPDKRKRMDRYCLYLKPEGYKLSEVHNKRSDFDVFVSALSVYNYKMKKKST